MRVACGLEPTVCEGDIRYYGWRVVFAANIGLMVGFSLYAYTFSIFIKPLSAQFGWSRETISGGFALSALAAAICSPLIGRWLDAYGSRRLLLTCFTVFGCAVTSLSLLRFGIWQFALTCFVIGAVGNAIQMGYTHAISTWFNTHRGTALGVMLAGEGIGLMITPMFAQSVVANLGWRAAYRTLGAIILLVGVPPAFRYASSSRYGQISAMVSQTNGTNWQEGLRSRAFWIIAAVLFLDSISVNGAMTHQAPLLTDRGISATKAALTISFLGIASFTGRLTAGWLLDRFAGRWVAFTLLLLAANGIFMLAGVQSFSIACVSAVLLGFGAGATSSVTPYLLTRYFGLKCFSTLYGLTWTFYAIAGGIGPLIMGRAFDRTGSYTVPLTVLGLATVLAAILMLYLPNYPAAVEVD